MFYRLCRAKRCADFLDHPRLPKPLSGVVFEESVYHRGEMSFVDGPVIEQSLPTHEPTLCGDARSSQMKRYLRDESSLKNFCAATDKRGLRCVGPWSAQDEIDAVYHYACLFAQETAQKTGVWVPYWYRDARLVGLGRVAYLIKGRERYHGAVMVDTTQHFTLAWVWLTPKWRRRGVFTRVWHQLERYHQGFKVLAPLSGPMQSFLTREDPNGLHEVVEETGGVNGV